MCAGCNEAAKATLSVLKKSSSRMVERDGANKVSPSRSPRATDHLGIGDPSRATWVHGWVGGSEHPIVRVASNTAESVRVAAWSKWATRLIKCAGC